MTFAKIYMAIFIQKKISISEPLRVQRSAAGIFKKLKALDMSLVIYHRKVFTSQIIKKTQEALTVLYKVVIYQGMTSLISSLQRSHMYARL